MRRFAGALLLAALFVVPAASAQQAPKYLNKQYSDAVHDLRSCLNVLAPQERRLVVLRSGIGPGDPASPQKVAAELKVAPAAVAKLQWEPIRKMRAAQKANQCGAGGQPASTKPASAKAAAAKFSTTPSAEPTDTAGWSSPKVLILLGIAGLCLLGVLRELFGAVRA